MLSIVQRLQGDPLSFGRVKNREGPVLGYAFRMYNGCTDFPYL